MASQLNMRLINAILRSMQKAVYSPEEAGHYALASPCYCHFTSPIRRYPDLTVHRLLHDLLDQRPPSRPFGILYRVGRTLLGPRATRRKCGTGLDQAQTASVFGATHGQSMDAVITGVQDFGFFAQGLEFPAEGLVHVHSLAEDRYHYDSGAHTLTGYRSGNAFRLGDMVRVEIARVDVDSRELDLRFVKPVTASAAPAPHADREPTATRPSARTTSANPPHLPPVGNRQKEAEETFVTVAISSAVDSCLAHVTPGGSCDRTPVDALTTTPLQSLHLP